MMEGASQMKKKRSMTKLFMFVVVIIIGVMGFLWLKDKVEARANTTKKDIYIVVQVNNLEPNVAEAIVEGDKVIGETGRQKDIIKDVTITDGDLVAVSKDGDLVALKDPIKKNITLGIRCKANISGPYIEGHGQEIKIGLPYVVCTENTQITGVIVDIKID